MSFTRSKYFTYIYLIFRNLKKSFRFTDNFVNRIIIYLKVKCVSYQEANYIYFISDRLII